MHGESCSHTNNTGIHLKELLLKSNETYHFHCYTKQGWKYPSITALLLEQLDNDWFNADLFINLTF